MPQALRFDYTAAMLPETGLEPSDLAGLGPTLEKLRDEVCDIDVKMLAGQIATPDAKRPLDAGFYILPDRQLDEYEAERQGSELGRILAVTKQLMTEVDRIVVLGVGGSSSGARALLDACCQPYFNYLSRGDRGSRPRIYFAGDNVDNDASQGLLHLLGAYRGQVASGVDESWGLVVVSKSGTTLETVAAFRQYLAALRISCGGDLTKVASRCIVVTGSDSPLRHTAGEIGCRGVFTVPPGVGGRYSVLSPVGLVPAALMGINVMQLLAGARAMNEQFRTSKIASNMVLQYVAVNHLLEKKRGASLRVLSVWSTALEAAGWWYDQLLATSLGKNLQCATPLTTVNSRDLHSRHQQHQQGRRDKIINQVIVEKCRFDPLPIGTDESAEEPWGDMADKTLVDVMAAAIEAASQSLREQGRPSTKLYFPVVDEYCMGQFFQMLMLATVVEGRLLGINPYGQPGVDAYKVKLNRNLSRQEPT